MGDASGATPLHAAATAPSSSPQLAAFLLAHGAGIDEIDAVGATPLMWAACQGNDAMVDVLLDAGASVFATDFEANTVAHYAAMSGHSPTLSSVLSAGPSVVHANPAPD